MPYDPNELHGSTMNLIAQGPEAVVRDIASIPEANFAAGERFFMSTDYVVKAAQATLGMSVHSPTRDPQGTGDPNKRVPKIAAGDWHAALVFIANLHLDDGVVDKSGGWGSWCLATQAAAQAAGIPWIADSYTRKLWTERTGQVIESSQDAHQ